MASIISEKDNKWRNFSIGDLTPPTGYVLVASELGIRTFTYPTNVAYGANGKFAYKTGVTGTITFSPKTFGYDPLPNVVKGGFAEKAPVQLATTPEAIKQQDEIDAMAANPDAKTDGTTTKKWLIYGVVGIAVIIGAVIVFKMIKKKK